MQISISVAHGPDFPSIVRQSSKALANAINRTIEEAQAAERESMAHNFIDRRSGFLSRMIKIAPSDRAQPDRLVGRLRVVGPEGAESRSIILTRHESPSGSQTAPGGYSIDPSVRIGGFFYIPTTVIRPQFAAIVPRKLYPANLRLVSRRDVTGTLKAKVHTTARGVYQLKGSSRTFVLTAPNSDVPIGIFQRLGKGGKGGGRGRSRGRRGLYVKGVGAVQRDDIQMIWSFKRTVTLKPRLHFYQVVPQTVRDRIAINYQGMLASAALK